MIDEAVALNSSKRIVYQHRAELVDWRPTHNNALGIALSAIDLPKVDLSQFAIPAASVEKTSERWRLAMAPLVDIAERVRSQMEIAWASMAPLVEQFRRVEELERHCERLERAGWLPHRTSPLHLFIEKELGEDEIDRRVKAFYESEWGKVSTSLRKGIETCDLDQEAKDCFFEALVAHGAGLYRCAPRLLFPEIERVARVELHDGALDKMASQNRLIEAIGDLTPRDMATTGVSGLRFYKKLTEHLYLHLKDAERVAIAAADPVPNRHAVVHGVVSYTSAKSSINAVLVADYLFQAVSTIKRFARDRRRGDLPFHQKGI